MNTKPVPSGIEARVAPRSRPKPPTPTPSREMKGGRDTPAPAMTNDAVITPSSEARPGGWVFPLNLHSRARRRVAGDGVGDRVVIGGRNDGGGDSGGY